MAIYEYKVVPAPMRGEKAKGVKTPEQRFAFRLEQLMNDMARDSWEFQRAETLPSEERGGLAQTVTNWRSVLVFRRALAVASDSPIPPEPALLAPPKDDTPPGDASQPAPEQRPEDAPVTASDGDLPDGDKHDAMPGGPASESEPSKPDRAEPSLERFMRLRAERPSDG